MQKKHMNTDIPEDARVCNKCGGEGKVRPSGFGQTISTCDKCKGTGYLPKEN